MYAYDHKSHAITHELQVLSILPSKVFKPYSTAGDTGVHVPIEQAQIHSSPEGSLIN